MTSQMDAVDEDDGIALAIVSGKGGVGKTTTAVNLGAALAGADLDVAIVDVDLGMANLGTFVGLTDPVATIHDVLTGDAPLEAACHEGGGLTVVPGSTDLDRFAETTTESLSDVISRLTDRFDVVLLDAGAGLSHDVARSIQAADAALLVTTAELSSLTDASKTGELVDRLDVPVVGAVFTRTGDGSFDDVEGIATALGRTNAVSVSVPYDRAVLESIRKGVPVTMYDEDAPAATAYRRLASSCAALFDLPASFESTAEAAFEWVDPASGSAATADGTQDGHEIEIPLDEMVREAGLDDSEAATAERLSLLERVRSRLS